VYPYKKRKEQNMISNIFITQVAVNTRENTAPATKGEM
jgi:hypothetical protein